MTPATLKTLSALLLRARQHGLGALLHPLLLLHREAHTVGQLAAVTGSSDAGMTSAVKRMVALGWAGKSGAAWDDRLVIVTLTDKGRAVAVKVFGELRES